MLRTNWWRPLPVLALLLLATMLSASAGTPDKLPGVALGWPLLLHLERGALLVAGLASVVLVGARATMGQFPSRLGQIEYAMGELADQYATVGRLHDERLAALRVGARSSSRAPDETADMHDRVVDAHGENDDTASE